MNCEILDVKAFLTVIDLGSFHKAALQLNMSQPTVSRRVKALEATVGATLLHRTTRRVTLSNAGRSLEPTLRRVVSEFESCSAVFDAGLRQASKVTIASIATAASSFLPRVLKSFSLRHPNVQFRIFDLSAEEGLYCVARGEADFGINFLKPSRADLRLMPLIDDHFVAAFRNDHSFASRPFIRWSDLSGQSLIISQRSGNRALIDRALAKSNVRLNWSFEDVHLATSFGLVEAGVGMAIIPRMASPAFEGSAITTIPICDPVVRRTVGIVERRQGQSSRAALALRKMLVQEMKRLNTSPQRAALQ
jgi:DNA-binding transcriptional LysR family regulator